jgi:NAD(P)-dependent dehydrogenase (short-subunit alcohol dehydrogenase family)
MTDVPQTFSALSGVVTGAGSGIGRAVSLLIAAGGGNVLAVDLDEDAARETAERAAGSPGAIQPHRADVRDPEQVKAYLAASRKRFGERHLAFFHNNAGVEGVHKTIEDTSEAEWDTVLDINLRSAFVALHYAIPAMRARGGGSILNTASLLSFKSAPGRADYTVSKHAIVGLTRTAASEVAGFGIRVNAICPGPIDTPLMARSERLVNPDDPGSERRRFEQGTPLGRYGRPEEIAEVAAFLLQPGGEYLTGACIAVDGGLSAV